jgi:hypothetical protein
LLAVAAVLATVLLLHTAPSHSPQQSAAMLAGGGGLMYPLVWELVKSIAPRFWDVFFENPVRS